MRKFDGNVGLTRRDWWYFVLAKALGLTAHERAGTLANFLAKVE